MKIEMVILPRARDGKSTFSSQAEVFMCQRVKMISFSMAGEEFRLQIIVDQKAQHLTPLVYQVI